MEKTISVRRTTITFSIWDLGGQREFVNMLPLVCNDAVAILFMFDLSRKSTLNSVKEWYRQARGFNKVRFSLIYHGPLKLNWNTISICRPRYHFLSAPSLIHLRRSRAMNKRRSQNRPSASPRRCTHLSSFVRHPHRSTCKRSSKSCSQRHLTSNASFPRLKGSVSPYCSTSMFECLERIDLLICSAPCIRADCTHTQCLSVPRRGATWVAWAVGSLPSWHFILPAVHLLYISPFVRSCIICLLLLHITLCLVNLSLYSSHTQPVPLPSIFQAVYLPTF